MKLVDLPQGSEWNENNYLVVGYGLGMNVKKAEKIVEILKDLAGAPSGSWSAIVPNSPGQSLRFIRIEQHYDE